MNAFATVDAEGPLRVVLVGAGNMGKAWMRLLDSTESVALTGLVDLDLELARRAADEIESEPLVGDSLTDVARAADAQAAIDVTVPPAHRAVNTEALLAGLPVLCEKPIAPTITEALSLIAVQQLTGQLLMTSQSRRYYPTLAQFKDIVSTLGDIGIVTTDFFKAPHFGGFRDEMDHPLLIDMAIHAFDAVRYLLDADPVAVRCTAFNPAWSWYRGDAAASAVFEFAGGSRYAYTGSWCSPGLETSWNGNWRVSGAHGSATWDGEAAPEAEYADAARTPPDRAHAVRPEIAGALDEFVHALRTGAVPSGEIRRNVHSLAMVVGAVRSADTGNLVQLADVFEDAYREALIQESRDDIRAVLESWGTAEGGLR